MTDETQRAFEIQAKKVEEQQYQYLKDKDISLRKWCVEKAIEGQAEEQGLKELANDLYEFILDYPNPQMAFHGIWGSAISSGDACVGDSDAVGETPMMP